MSSALLFERDTDVVDLLSRLLRIRGFENIVRARDGFEVLESMQNGKFDLLVCDDRLRELDGVDLLEAVRGISPHAAVAVLTAPGQGRSSLESRRAAGAVFFEKPLRDTGFFLDTLAEMAGIS